MYLSWKMPTERSPSAPASRQTMCARAAPTLFASLGSQKENTKVTAEYMPKQMPPQAMPSV